MRESERAMREREIGFLREKVIYSKLRARKKICEEFCDRVCEDYARTMCVLKTPFIFVARKSARAFSTHALGTKFSTSERDFSCAQRSALVSCSFCRHTLCIPRCKKGLYTVLPGNDSHKVAAACFARCSCDITF